MDIDLQHRKILGFQLVQFSSLLLRVQMMLKNYLMRTIVSTIRTLAYGISKYLVQIILRTLNKGNNKIQNSTLMIAMQDLTIERNHYSF